MKNTIAFLPRNQFHTNVFIKIGEHLNKKYGFNTTIIRELGDIDDVNVFEYEKQIEKIFHSVDISYESMEELRKKYPDIDFMRAIYSEREFNYFPEYFGYDGVSHESQMRYLVSCFKVFEEWVESNNITAVVSELLTGLPDSILYGICKHNLIRYISVRSSKMIAGTIICDKYYDEPSRFIETYEKFKSSGVPEDIKKKAKEHINEIIEKNEAPAYMKLTKKRFKLFTIQRIKTLFRRIGKEKIHTNSISLFQHPILNPARYALHRFINIRKTKKSLAKWFSISIKEGEKYFIYPLHYEPEASTLIRAFQFSDQMCVIKQIARVLPLGVRLVVKEHKGNQGYRKSDFYKKLYYLPNVLLVPPDYNGRNLIEDSLGVITLTGRMGWEAMILDKPVIAFGETFWTSFKRVMKPETWRDLKDCIHEIVNKDYNNISSNDKTFSDDDDLVIYAAAYISLIHDANFVLGTDDLYSSKNVESLASMLNNEILAR